MKRITIIMPAILISLIMITGRNWNDNECDNKNSTMDFANVTIELSTIWNSMWIAILDY